MTSRAVGRLLTLAQKLLVIGTHPCGTTMPILTIMHVTAYHYKQPVAFGEHRIMLRPRDDEDQKVLESELEIAPSQANFPGRGMSSEIMSQPLVSQTGPRSFASKAPYVSTTRRPASPKPISRILPGPIRLPTGRKIGPASRASSRRCLCTQASIVGPSGFFARTDQPTPATFSSI